MAEINIITGHTGTEHVSAEDVRNWNVAIIDQGDCVLRTNEMFKAEVLSANTVRIYSGDGILQGTHFRIDGDNFVDIAIDNGTEGFNRNDLIVARYTKNALTEVEAMSIEVIKGTETNSTAEDPEYTSEGDVLNGNATILDMPLWRIPLNGTTVKEPEKLFTECVSLGDEISRIADAETNISSLQASVSSDESRLGSLETRATSAETRLTTAESNISTAQTDIDSAETRLTTAESDIDALETRATSVETRLTTAESDIDSAKTDIDSLETRATNAETRITEAENNIQVISSLVGGSGTQTTIFSDDGSTITVTDSAGNTKSTTEFSINSDGNDQVTETLFNTDGTAIRTTVTTFNSDRSISEVVQ